jgi:hypothetical protein
MSVPLPGLGVLLGQGNDCEFGVCSFTDYNQAQTSALLNQAYLEATAGRILGIMNIYRNSLGKYDFGVNSHHDDTFTVCGATLKAFNMGNLIAGFQGAAYDRKYLFTSGGGTATSAVYLVGFLIHAYTKTKEDFFDTTGFPDITRGVSLGWSYRGALVCR